MQRKVLIVCNTVLQIIFAVNLRCTEFINDQVDIIVSDHLNESVSISKNIEKTRAFYKVYHVNSYDYTRKLNKYSYKNRISWVKDELRRKYILESLVDIEKDYDVLLVANLDDFSELLLEYISNYLNPDIEFLLYEDGLSSYCVLGNIFNNQYSATKSKIHTMLDNIIKRKYACKRVSGLYVFNPNIVKWSPPFPLLKMKKIDRKNSYLKSILNETFDYGGTVDTYDKKVIFFEESYSVEGIGVDDIQLIENIAKAVGKDNIMVKIHPRNPVNRFRNLGYKTNVNTAIPWEVIVLNQDFKNTLLLSIASGSIANPYILFGIKTKSVSLLNCLNFDFDENGRLYNEFLTSNIYLMNKDIFFMPDSYEELFVYISKMFNKDSNHNQ